MELPVRTSTRSLIIGMGEIGSALYKVLSEHGKVFCRDLDSKNEFESIDVLHISFPYNNNFVEQVNDYIEQYNPFLVIIYSTVDIGTCEAISPDIVHSPIEGKHPRLDESIKLMPRWLGCANDNALDLAINFWKPYNQMIRSVQSSKATEFLKLRSTARYGINLVFADYEANVAKALDMDYDVVKAFDRDYNWLYHQLGMPEYTRYILDPPNGVIGGHCVVPNAEILDVQYPHSLLKQIKKYKPKEGGKA